MRNILNTSLLLLGPLSGSVAYFMLHDVYHVYVTKKLIGSRDFKYQFFINPGIIIGGFLGYWRYRLGMPILDYLMKNKINFFGITSDI